MTTASDPRLHAFCSSQLPELFNSITYRGEIDRPDPFDVETIHHEARAQFDLMLHRASAPGTLSGRILLLLGDAGAGKTHLMRAFRNSAHSTGLGYFSYMQMTSSVSNYARYVLRQTLDSLDKPYLESSGPTTGMKRLSNVLAEDERIVSPDELAEIRDEETDSSRLMALVNRVADRIVNWIVGDGRRHGFDDVNLVRALLYLQRRSAAMTSRVLRYLRCESLTPFDSDSLGGLLTNLDEDEPLRMLTSVARLISALDSGALIICLDQLEEIAQMGDPGLRFARAMGAAVNLVEIPNVLVILCCLEEFYNLLRTHLLPPQRDRIEKDPSPVNLIANRSERDIHLIVSRRLNYLYDSAGVPAAEDDAVYPFTPESLASLANLRTRDVLDWCRQKREESIRTSRPPTDGPRVRRPSDPSPIDLDQLWNDHKIGSFDLPTTEQASLELLRETISSCGRELDNGCHFVVAPQGTFLLIDTKDCSGTSRKRTLQGLCEQKAVGGGLARRITELEESANGSTPVAVRSTEFPSNPNTKIAKQLGDFIRRGGRRVVIQDSEWRTMAAMAPFSKEHERHPLFPQWLKQSKPITQLAAIRQILDVDNLTAEASQGRQQMLLPTTAEPDQTEVAERPGAAVVPVANEVVSPAPAVTSARPASVGVPRASNLHIGTTIGFRKERYSIRPSTLVRHAAFLGGSGSGKTTLALTIIEQLLMQGVPVVLIDRKGDLCSYAQDTAWKNTLENPDRTEERRRLKEGVDVAVYTPGALPGKGRPLTISIAPPGLGHLPSAERSQLANYCAFALGGLLKYKPADQTRIAILGIAIAVLSELSPDKPVNLKGLVDFIAAQDSVLLNAIGRLDTKHFDKLVQDLETLNHLQGNLFRADGELLSADSLFKGSRNGATSRTHLSIVSTSFLGDQASVTFWVAQLLLEISRYATKNPSSELQAVVMFDEADLYLPAQSKPPTKEPMENLLKRARSAGIGLMLATQSPGDLDYKSRDQISTWFVGRVKENTALQKLKPMLSEAKSAPSSKLANQQTGEFFAIAAGDVTQIKADMSLVRAQQVSAEEILALASQVRRGV